MILWAHTIIKNEDRYLWYAVTSVIDYVDRFLLWDTGSTDHTLKIVNELKKRYPSKISFREVGDVSPDQFTVVRQKMLNESECDWIIIVDGDEVWWDEKIIEIRDLIDTKGKKIDSIVSRYKNVVGDIFHYQDEVAGRYQIDGKRGYLTIRAFNRNIEGLKFSKPHGQQGIYDEKNVLIQERNSQKRQWVDGYSYLHFTNMQRSQKRSYDLIVPKRDFKLKYEIGKMFPSDFYYPEVFFREKPQFINDVWSIMPPLFLCKAAVLEAPRYIKRKLIKNQKSGY